MLLLFQSVVEVLKGNKKKEPKVVVGLKGKQTREYCELQLSLIAFTESQTLQSTLKSSNYVPGIVSGNLVVPLLFNL